MRDGEVGFRLADIARAEAHETRGTVALLGSMAELARLPALGRLLTHRLEAGALVVEADAR